MNDFNLRNDVQEIKIKGSSYYIDKDEINLALNYYYKGQIYKVKCYIDLSQTDFLLFTLEEILEEYTQYQKETNVLI